MDNKLSLKPCPICHVMMMVIGQDSKSRKLTSCGHRYKFKKTRSQKEMGRKYITTEYGLELAPTDSNKG